MANQKIDERQAAMARKAKALMLDYKRVFSTEQGKRVLADMIANHFVMAHTYTKGDPHGMSFKEGQRNVVLRIMTMIDSDPNAFFNRIMEINKHVNTENS